MRELARDKGRLEHILSAMERVSLFTSGMTKEQLVADVLHLHATVVITDDLPPLQAQIVRYLSEME